MSKACCYHDGVSEHRFDESSFPITIGSSDVDIKLPGLSGADGFAYVDFAEGRPFIQPEDRSRVFLNGNKLLTSSWLQAQDVIKIGSTQLSCQLDKGLIKLHLLAAMAQKKRILQPPEEARPETVSSDRSIVLIAGNAVVKQKTKARTAVTLRSILLSASFILLLILVGFVFTAVPVTLNVMPKPDNIDLEGSFPGITLGKHFLVWPGKYRVNAEKTGYISLDQEVVISYSGADSFAFQLEKLGGILMLTSEPKDGAEVIIDGQLVGLTPLHNIQVSPGKHRIIFKQERYQDNIQELEIEGEGKQQYIVGKLIPNWAPIDFSSMPEAAEIKVDGEALGKTPLKLALLAGEHQIQIKKTGYEAWRKTIQVKAGQPQQLPQVELLKQSGILVLTTVPGDVSVVINDKYRGQSPLSLKLPPDRKHRLKLFKPGYAELSKTTVMASGETQKIQLQLAAEIGKIKLQDFPSGAKLYIDGKQQTYSNIPLKLTTRRHKLEVRKDGYQTFSTSITPRLGFTQQLRVRLTPNVTAAPVNKALTALEKSSLIYIEPGRFMMGASRREQGRRSNEVMHEVELSKPFYISKKEVSNAEYRKYQPDHHSGSAQGLSLDGKNHPVVNVSWADAVGYCNWLSQRSGLTPVYIEKRGVMVARKPVSNGYRLPTEAEWAWVARYAKQNAPLKFPWGSSYPPAADSGNYARGDRFAVTAPVASYKSNRLGMYDIGGNVAEWVHDYYSVFPAFSSKVSNNPLGPENGKHHVVRGSSWKQYGISELRLSYRDYADIKRPDLGFRVARYAN